MNLEEIINFISVVTLSISVAVVTKALLKVVQLRLKHKEPNKPYSERLAEQTANLSKASLKVDFLIAEMALDAKNREQTLRQLEAELEIISAREKAAKDRIDALGRIPLPVAEHFAELVAPGEKRSAKRDYVLFGMGVIVSAIIQLLLGP